MRTGAYQLEKKKSPGKRGSALRSICLRLVPAQFETAHEPHAPWEPCSSQLGFSATARTMLHVHRVKRCGSGRRRRAARLRAENAWCATLAFATPVSSGRCLGWLQYDAQTLDSTIGGELMSPHSPPPATESHTSPRRSHTLIVLMRHYTHTAELPVSPQWSWGGGGLNECGARLASAVSETAHEASNVGGALILIAPRT